MKEIISCSEIVLLTQLNAASDLQWDYKNRLCKSIQNMWKRKELCSRYNHINANIEILYHTAKARKQWGAKTSSKLQEPLNAIIHWQSPKHEKAAKTCIFVEIFSLIYLHIRLLNTFLKGRSHGPVDTSLGRSHIRHFLRFGMMIFQNFTYVIRTYWLHIEVIKAWNTFWHHKMRSK